MHVVPEYICKNVHSYSDCDSPKMETTQNSSNRRMDHAMKYIQQWKNEWTRLKPTDNNMAEFYNTQGK